jgi:hypothetical protein
VVARVEIAGSPIVGCELINLIDTVDYLTYYSLVAEVAENEFVGRRVSKIVAFEIDSADPISFRLKTFHQMAAYETAGAIDENSFHL